MAQHRGVLLPLWPPGDGTLTHLLILGASVRAAAFSALRAGLSPVCGDLFADVDLRRRCRTARAEGYPRGLLQVAEQWPGAPWMYTGGLENHAALVGRISATRCLWGNPPSVLRRVRSPSQLAAALSGGPWNFPAWRPSGEGLPRDGSWLRKGRRSSGGIQVRSWDPTQHAPDRQPAWYFQHRVPGLPCAALYVAAAGRAVLLGVTEQLVGSDWTGAAPFRYAGSLGPLDLSASQCAALASLGDRLAERFHLVGLFGVDLMISDHDIWVIEVNPRYPASAEVLERAFDIPAVGLHVTACRDGDLPSVPQGQARICGKAILFARHDLIVHPTAARKMAALLDDPWPAVADVPGAATTVLAGHPVMTVLAEGTDMEDLRKKLRAAVLEWQEILHR